MDSGVAALARCVGDVDVFARDHWGRRPLLRREAGRFDDLLDVAAVEEVLLTAARRPEFRLVRDGATLPPGDVTVTAQIGGRRVEDVADVGRIAEHLAGGATVVLQSLHRTWLPLTRFCRALERATSHPVQANAYLSPAGARGLGKHHDDHDVLVVQLLGTKSWEVDGLGSFDLSVGDVLYLPRGTDHAAAADTEPTLHLTIGLLRETYGDALGRVLAAAELDLDDPLPLGFARPDHDGSLVAELGKRLARAAEHLAVVDAAELAATEVARASTRRPPLLTGQLQSVLALSSLDDATRLRRRPDQPARLSDGDDGRLVLELADRTLHLPATTRAALELILGADELAVGDLADLTEAGRAVLARRLVREGLLEVVQ